MQAQAFPTYPRLPGKGFRHLWQEERRGLKIMGASLALTIFLAGGLHLAGAPDKLAILSVNLGLPGFFIAMLKLLARMRTWQYQQGWETWTESLKQSGREVPNPGDPVFPHLPRRTRHAIAAHEGTLDAELDRVFLYPILLGVAGVAGLGSLLVLVLSH